MPEKHYGSEDVSRCIARIDRDLYERVQSNLHYGQQGQLLRRIYTALDKKINENKFGEVIDFIYNGKDLLLELPKANTTKN